MCKYKRRKYGDWKRGVERRTRSVQRNYRDLRFIEIGCWTTWDGKEKSHGLRTTRFEWMNWKGGCGTDPERSKERRKFEDLSANETRKREMKHFLETSWRRSNAMRCNDLKIQLLRFWTRKHTQQIYRKLFEKKRKRQREIWTLLWKRDEWSVKIVEQTCRIFTSSWGQFWCI